jgi:ankyrin repeat protein
MSSLITAGARLNDVNADGLSPLMWAAWNNQEQSVDILLKNGASATLKDRVCYSLNPLGIDIWVVWKMCYRVFKI